VVLGTSPIRGASAGLTGSAARPRSGATIAVSGWPGQLPFDFLHFYLLLFAFCFFDPREARGRAGCMKYATIFSANHVRKKAVIEYIKHLGKVIQG
jgi:hypothetical protein